MKTLLLVCGGPSAEHDVSLLSAESIRKAVSNTWNVRTVQVGTDGIWRDTTNTSIPCVVARTSEGVQQICDDGTTHNIDAVFPIIHGPYGEDGVLQGFLETLDIPYVGSGVHASALCMDKAAWKEHGQQRGWNLVPWLTYLAHQTPSYEEASQWLGSTKLFVKAARLGSSLGIALVKDEASFNQAVEEARYYDDKIVVEKALTKPQELECAVLSYPDVAASGVGEIIPHHEFYTFDAKYVDPNGATLHVPAEIDLALSESIRKLSIDAFTSCDCQGLARIDFLYSEGQLYINEINTLPGFTSISLYPRLWQHEGVSYSDLIERLLQDALRRYDNKKRPDYTSIKERANTAKVALAS